jgi:transposase InsO family protein
MLRSTVIVDPAFRVAPVRRRTFGSFVERVEAATADWVHWFNTERTHASIWDLTPTELEQLGCAPRQALETVG